MIDRGQIAGLVDAYKGGALAIDAIADPIEREIGKTALRENATSTVNVASRARGVSEDVVGPLRQWISDYGSSGILAQKVVDKFDSAVRKLAEETLKQVGSWAWTGNAGPLAGGIFGFIAGIALMVVNFGQDVGAHVISALVAGALPGSVIYFAVRGASKAGPAIAAGARTSWADASNLGSAAEKALAEAVLPAERRVWAAVGGTPHPGVPFVAKVRGRAKAIVGSAIAAGIIGSLLFLIGILQAYSEWQAAQPLGR